VPTVIRHIRLCLLSLLMLGVLAGCDPSSRCPTDRVCVFEHNSMRGHMASFPRGDRRHANNTWVGPSKASPDDRASSLANNTNRWVVFHLDERLAGHAICVRPQGFISNLEAFAYDIFDHNFGDALSSHAFTTTEPDLVAQGGPCDHKV
jgi:Peptidase inhibitor family I36